MKKNWLQVFIETKFVIVSADVSVGANQLLSLGQVTVKHHITYAVEKASVNYK
jgi:hypothetical protein